MNREIVKLNIGCGPNALPGWINIDNSPNALLSKTPVLKKVLFKLGLLSVAQFNASWKHHSLFFDVRKGLPFPSESIDFIYCSHLLEHLTRDNALKLLLECNRVLKDKGAIRLVLPDLKKMAKQYVDGKCSANGFLEKLGFFKPCKRHSHKWMYDFESLREMLKKTGFGNVKQTPCGKSIVPGIEKLDSGKSESFFVDAWK